MLCEEFWHLSVGDGCRRHSLTVRYERYLFAFGLAVTNVVSISDESRNVEHSNIGKIELPVLVVYIRIQRHVTAAVAIAATIPNPNVVSRHRGSYG